jgi:hypothetical protein
MSDDRARTEWLRADAAGSVAAAKSDTVRKWPVLGTLRRDHRKCTYLVPQNITRQTTASMSELSLFYRRVGQMSSLGPPGRYALRS